MSLRHGLTAALAAAAAAVALTVPGADAVNYNYCSGSLAAGSTCDGSAVALTRNQAIDDNGSNSVCAGAVLSGGGFYGSYACGSGSATHCYSGTLALAPRLRNNEGFSQVMHGHAAYSESC